MKKLLLLLFWYLSSTAITAAHADRSPWGSGNSQNQASRDNAGKKWSSLLTVDPSNIISHMVKHGGLVLPKNTEKDLKVFAKVCSVDEVLLNVVERKLQIRNFVLHVEGDRDDVALRIGRVLVEWDSYLRPCLSVEVDDIEILVEFLNIMLSKNNWYVEGGEKFVWISLP
jgi:hypothetical protein